jgi:diaminopimelate decarboxylase
MKILWRVSIKESSNDNLATVFSNKFGDDLLSLEQANVRFKQIRDMGINLAGIHFHCGSG